MTTPILFQQIETTLKSLDFTTISSERKEILQPLVDFIQSKVTDKKEIRLNLICTHNSRRSHLSQVWAQTAATYYNIRMCFVIQEAQKQPLCFLWQQKL